MGQLAKIVAINSIVLRMHVVNGIQANIRSLITTTPEFYGLRRTNDGSKLLHKIILLPNYKLVHYLFLG